MTEKECPQKTCPDCPLLEDLKDKLQQLVAKVHLMEVEFGTLMADLGKAAHDMNEPLRAIRFHIDDLMRDMKVKKEFFCFPSEDIKLLQGMKDRAAYLAEMIEDITDIFKMSDPAGTRNGFEEFSLKEAAILAKDNLSATVSEVEGSISIIGDFPTVSSKRGKWVRVFQNLFSNSLRYNVSETPTVKVWFSNNKIYVEDNGIGIPEDKKDKIFNLFVRLPDREEMAQGTGAGLYMVNHFLMMEGCLVSVESDGYSGSTFIIDVSSLL